MPFFQAEPVGLMFVCGLVIFGLALAVSTGESAQPSFLLLHMPAL